MRTHITPDQLAELSDLDIVEVFKYVNRTKYIVRDTTNYNSIDVVRYDEPDRQVCRIHYDRYSHITGQELCEMLNVSKIIEILTNDDDVIINTLWNLLKTKIV